MFPRDHSQPLVQRPGQMGLRRHRLVQAGTLLPGVHGVSEDRAGSLDGVKLTRAVGAAAHDRTCFYGVNFQFSVNY